MKPDVLDAVEMPTEIVLHTKSRTLELAWTSSRLNVKMKVLREHCPCSKCEKNRIDGRLVIDVDASPEIISAVPVGNYALNLSFSDGHDRGIYPWSYLRSLGTKHNCTKTVDNIHGVGIGK